MAYTTIDDPTKFFSANLWTGNGASTSITTGHATDWLWIKNRNDTQRHNILDSIRGVTKRLSSNTTDVEATESNMLSSFDSNGFTLGTDSSSYGTNTSSKTYVGWSWKAGGSASSNSDGSITSTVSANTTAGFSICTYTGNSGNPSNFGHGLGVAPSMVIIKNRDYSGDPTGWVVYHKSIGANYSFNLNTTNGRNSNTTSFGNTTPSSSVVYVGDDGGNWGTNLNTYNYVAYCFAEKKGYSKIGTFTGNQSTDGTFVYLGFRPAWVMFKEAVGTSPDNWFIYDNKRSTFNPLEKTLRANTNGAETDLSATAIDMLSNGFKLRTADTGLNESGGTYIFMAFAEAPFVTAGTKAAGTAR